MADSQPTLFDDAGEVRRCKTCQGPMKPEAKGPYCSRACYWVDRKAKIDAAKIVKLCEKCGRSFKPRSEASRFCSKKCSGQAHKRDRICLTCGKHFWPRPTSGRGKNAQKYCSRQCRGIPMRKQRKCRWCGKTFTRVGHAQPTYCSPECFAQGRCRGKNLKTYTCARCGVEFQRWPSQRREEQAKHFCSGNCRAASRVYAKGADHPQWKGGTYVSSWGYEYELDRGRRGADGDYAYIAVHIRVAQEKLGRPLIKGEHVHHLDGNKRNNSPDNLLVLGSIAHKKLHHFYGSQFQEEHAEKGDLLAITQAFLATLSPTPL